MIWPPASGHASRKSLASTKIWNLTFGIVARSHTLSSHSKCLLSVSMGRVFNRTRTIIWLKQTHPEFPAALLRWGEACLQVAHTGGYPSVWSHMCMRFIIYPWSNRLSLAVATILTVKHSR
jgi:hypothetical protein